MKLSNDTKKNDNALQKYFQNKTDFFKDLWLVITT